MVINSISTASYNRTTKRKYQNFGHESNLPTYKKGVIFTTSAAGMIAALALCGKAQKINIFKPKELKNIDIGAKEIYALAAGSILGGIGSGLVVDNKNKKEKYREAIQQMIGNIAFPVTFVSAVNWLYKKTPIPEKLPKVNNKILNALIQAAIPTALTLSALVAGIITGNRFTNNINNKIFDKKEHRDIKITDFAAHVDDLCLGATLVAKNLSTDSTSLVGSVASKLVPPALIIPGYMTGISNQNKH